MEGIREHCAIQATTKRSSEKLLNIMKVTYSLALTILAVAVASAGRIPTNNADEIQNHHRYVPNLLDKRFHKQWHHQIDNRHPAHKIQHHGFKEHAKPPRFPATEIPITESTSDDISTTNTTTIISIITDPESESESEASPSAISTTGFETENVSAEAKTEVPHMNSSTEAIVETTGSDNLDESAISTLNITNSESVDASTATIAVSTGKAEIDEGNATTVIADSQTTVETPTTTKRWWEYLLFWQ